MIAPTVASRRPADRDEWLADAGRLSGARYRFYAPDGALVADSWRGAPPSYQLRDPATQGWSKDIARALDRGFNAIVGERNPPDFVEPARDVAASWQEIATARARQRTVSMVRVAPDLTPVISSATVLRDGSALLTTENDRQITRTVRAQRKNLAVALVTISLFSVLLSLFLARTIVRPLRRLALAAHRVRLGRSREVRVPRLPTRTDEIGLLARAVSDMSQSLRQRIDNIEAFAADVTHELKNPLASLRSAMDGLDRVDDPALRNNSLIH